MRVGLLYEKTGAGGDFGPIVEQVATADSLGMDALWLEERHGDDHSFGSVPIVLAALAKRTRSIRLGAFKIMALGHPAGIAEDFAMIDLMSGGRLNFGAAVGKQAEDFRMFRVPFAERAERFAEALDVVLTAWSADEFSYAGRYYQFPSHHAPGDRLITRRRGRTAPYLPQWERGPETPDLLTVTPKPLQQPRPHVWVLADDASLITFAAEHGHSIVLPAADPKMLETAAKTYDATLDRVRRARHEVEVAVIVDVALAGERVAPGTLDHLHRLQAATGMNQVIWRVPYPDCAHGQILEAFRHFAGEVQPMLQA